jgi:hypothetical protein
MSLTRTPTTIIDLVIECEHMSPQHCFTASITGRSRAAATLDFSQDRLAPHLLVGIFSAAITNELIKRVDLT